jgi:hypothetical protein
MAIIAISLRILPSPRAREFPEAPQPSGACPYTAAAHSSAAVNGNNFFIALPLSNKIMGTVEAVPKLQLWNSSLRFIGKSGRLTAFSKS